MTYIPPRTQEYEKVALDEWIEGEITEVQEFKDVPQVYTNEEGEQETKNVTKIRFKFSLYGYEYPHYSRKMTASMNERANLFLFLNQLYNNALVPDIGTNLDKLKGVKVKTMWSEVKLKSGDMYQFVDKIRTLQDLPAIWE